MRKAFSQPVDSLTIAPTAIANDAIVRVLQQRKVVANQGQFFALATCFIRQLIADYRRHRMAEKRGGGKRGAGLAEADDVADDTIDAGDDRVAAALSKVNDACPSQAEVVPLHAVCEDRLATVA